MRHVSLGVGFVGACGLAAMAACVGDETTPQDASTNDAAVVDQTTVDQGAPDAPADTTTVNEASVDAGPDVCSNAPVGSSFQLPSSTFNGALAFQSSPIIAGDYTATTTGVYNGCSFGCPTVRFGNMLGGLTITSTGASTASVQRHIEVLQGSTHVVIQDRFDVSFDQLSRTMTVTPRCEEDGGATGDGGTWTGGFPLANDGGPAGTVVLQFPDVPVLLITSDGGPGGTGQPYVNFTKQ
jgi:hypothetical protein